MNRQQIRAFRRLFLLVSLTAMVAACDAFSGEFKRKWTEDVALSGGRVITIERQVKIRESDALGGGAYNAVEIEAALRFTRELAHLPQWEVPLRAQVLYVDEAINEWVLVATTTSCEVLSERAHPRYWYATDRPPTSYFEFRLRGAAWAQVPLSPQSIGRDTNLYGEYKALKTSHVAIADKRLDLRTAKQYQRVIERPEHTCMRTNYTQPIWSVEDAVLEALERENATPEETARVGELLARTRIQHFRRGHIPSWTKDSDPGTVEILIDSGLNHGQPGVTDDGQVIYLVLGSSPRSEDLLKTSYAHRFRAEGLERFSR